MTVLAHHRPIKDWLSLVFISGEKSRMESGQFYSKRPNHWAQLDDLMVGNSYYKLLTILTVTAVQVIKSITWLNKYENSLLSLIQIIKITYCTLLN